MTREDYLQTVLAAYAVVRVLSDRNGGQVLHLRHKEKGKDVVLRSMPKPVAAYERLCSLHCDDLPDVYDAVSCEDGQIVWEEFIDGLTVAEVLETGQRYRYRGAKAVLQGVCRALSALHGQGIVHRDVKPENVMIASDGRVVLIDMSISREVKDAPADTAVMGTVGYAAPEQLGIAQSDARTDVYAAAVLLNILLTGKHPSELVARGRAGKIVRKGTQLNRDDRVQTAEKLLEML